MKFRVRFLSDPIVSHSAEVKFETNPRSEIIKAFAIFIVQQSLITEPEIASTI